MNLFGRFYSCLILSDQKHFHFFSISNDLFEKNILKKCDTNKYLRILSVKRKQKIKTFPNITISRETLLF